MKNSQYIREELTRFTGSNCARCLRTLCEAPKDSSKWDSSPCTSQDPSHIPAVLCRVLKKKVLQFCLFRSQGGYSRAVSSFHTSGGKDFAGNTEAIIDNATRCVLDACLYTTSSTLTSRTSTLHTTSSFTHAATDISSVALRCYLLQTRAEDWSLASVPDYGNPKFAAGLVWWKATQSFSIPLAC